MTKKIDIELEEMIQCFLQHGWKKNGYQIYKFMDKDKKFIVSIMFDRDRKGVLSAKLYFHNVDLNEFSNFVRQFNKIEPPDIGLFSGFKIPVSLHLRGWDSLPLVGTIVDLVYKGPDHISFVRLCDETADRLYHAYKDPAALAELYDSSDTYRRSSDSLFINLYLKRYAKVRELFKDHFGPDGRAMTFVMDYMNRYGLR